jgi:diguanylate cyclase (GGDEF)-like protein/PAS domain S-box-containing protein
VRRSIVARTTLAILVLSMILGLAFATIVSRSVDRHEHQRAEIRLEQLLATVERTAQIACYLKDRTLAAEIAQGLIGNRAVSGVSITSSGVALARIGNTTRSGTREAGVSQITRHIYSPFDTHEAVGEVSLFVDRAAVHVEASDYSRAAILAMGLQAALVAAGVALAVYFFSTRSIRAVSNELHKIRLETAARLRVPPGNRLDEIGTLVTDVNTLIATLEDLLISERELRIQHEMGERRMRLIFEKAESGIFVLDGRGVLESWNPAFIRLLRLSPEQPPESGATQLQQLLAPHAVRIDELIRDCLTTGQSNDLDLEIAVEGNPRIGWIEIALKPIGASALQGIVNDITDRKHVELAAQEMATHDTLTGLLNRRGLNIGLDAAFSQRSVELLPEIVLLQIDLDYFKEVNDTHGHESGDRVLRHVARILQRNARRGDLIARPGGDEFVVTLTGIADLSKAQQIAKSIIADIKLPIDIDGKCVAIGASIGIAFARGKGDSPDALLRRADDAMYCAKKAGRGQVCMVPPTGPLQESAVA